MSTTTAAAATAVAAAAASTTTVAGRRKTKRKKEYIASDSLSIQQTRNCHFISYIFVWVCAFFHIFSALHCVPIWPPLRSQSLSHSLALYLSSIFLYFFHFDLDVECRCYLLYVLYRTMRYDLKALSLPLLLPLLLLLVLRIKIYGVFGPFFSFRFVFLFLFCLFARDPFISFSRVPSPLPPLSASLYVFCLLFSRSVLLPLCIAYKFPWNSGVDDDELVVEHFFISSHRLCNSSNWVYLTER